MVLASLTPLYSPGARAVQYFQRSWVRVKFREWSRSMVPAIVPLLYHQESWLPSHRKTLPVHVPSACVSMVMRPDMVYASSSPSFMV
jgi:hypothetical protein